MKTHEIFYTLLQNLPSLLFELLEQSPTIEVVKQAIKQQSSK
ncbi:MAG: hypothetical protein ACKPEO_10440 [Sphaerospermopsis kisseleviana]